MGKKKEVTLGLEEIEDKKKTVQSHSEKEKQKTAKSKKTTKKKARTATQRSARYKKALAKYEAKQIYDPTEAVKILKNISNEKFNSTVELHLNMNKSSIKGEVDLPYTTGKTKKIAVYDADVKKKIDDKQLDFDVLIATPKDMGEIVKYAKLLGPKGLMPSTKKGTLVENTKVAMEKFQGNLVRYSTEVKFPIMHLTIGKINLTEKELVANFNTLVNAIGVNNIKQAFIKSTMGPSIKVKLPES